MPKTQPIAPDAVIRGADTELFTVAITKELQHRIKAFTRTEEDRMRFVRNALAVLADVYEGKRKMPESVIHIQEQKEELTFF